MQLEYCRDITYSSTQQVHDRPRPGEGNSVQLTSWGGANGGRASIESSGSTTLDGEDQQSGFGCTQKIHPESWKIPLSPRFNTAIWASIVMLSEHMYSLVALANEDKLSDPIEMKMETVQVNSPLPLSSTSVSFWSICSGGILCSLTFQHNLFFVSLLSKQGSKAIGGGGCGSFHLYLCPASLHRRSRTGRGRWQGRTRRCGQHGVSFRRCLVASFCLIAARLQLDRTHR
nr:uncharacterized protein LOC112292125 [Physcomitrium patens]|eukprot:XP_024396043.1 uncharacterized protein LOC112292125 [Physcomitrella patens]